MLRSSASNTTMQRREREKVPEQGTGRGKRFFIFFFLFIFSFFLLSFLFWIFFHFSIFLVFFFFSFFVFLFFFSFVFPFVPFFFHLLFFFFSFFSRRSRRQNQDKNIVEKFLGLGGQGLLFSVSKAHLRVTLPSIFFISLFSCVLFLFFLEEKCSFFFSFFLSFFQKGFIAGIGIRARMSPPWSVLYGDVVS